MSFARTSNKLSPKGLMKEELFSRVIKEYLKIGGGPVSLTPMVGDVLLDKKLGSRMKILRDCAEKITASITTNLFGLGNWPEDKIVEMLKTFQRIHVSCYGITAQENMIITQKALFETFCIQMSRLLRLRKNISGAAELALAFRTLYDYSQSQLDEFQQAAFGEIITQTGATATYANWGNSMRGNLPGHARWIAEKENHTTCLLLAIALQVYHEGRVSACACCDYDASAELTLGSLAESSLDELYNGEKNRAIWEGHQNGRLPSICRHCTFHSPLSALTPDHPAMKNITHFIGG